MNSDPNPASESSAYTLSPWRAQHDGRMQSMILHAPGDARIEWVPIPVLEPGDLLVEVKSATTCGTDLKAFRRGHPQIPIPGPLGHEYSGIVVEAGPGAKFEVGTEVMGVHSAPCGDCFWCQRQQGNLCESIMDTKVLGTYAEAVRIPKRIADKHVFEKPPEISFDVASLLEPTACVAQALIEARLNAFDQKVLVIGPGAIGLLFVAGLRTLGVSEIWLAGRNPDRLSVGKEFGAQTISYADLDIHDFDIVIECTGQVEVWEKSIEFCRKGGKVILFGGCPGGTQACFDTGRLHYSQIQLISPFHFGTEAVHQSMQWLRSGIVDFQKLISGAKSLKNPHAIFEDLHQGKAIKYVIHPAITREEVQ